MFQLIPGDVVDAQFGQMEYSALDVDKIKASMGLDQPVHIRFARWFGPLLRGDLGNSLWTSRPVIDEIVPRIPVSFELGLMALIISMLIGVPIGTYSAMRQDTAGDYIARSAATLAICVPSFWLAIIIMVYPSVWLDWTPPLQYIMFGDAVRDLLDPRLRGGQGSYGTVGRKRKRGFLSRLINPFKW